MINAEDREAYLKKVKESLEIAGDICKEKEIDFLEGVLEQLNDDTFLTEKQKDWIDDIYEKACAHSE